jgi:hypothetical protein
MCVHISSLNGLKSSPMYSYFKSCYRLDYTVLFESQGGNEVVYSYFRILPSIPFRLQVQRILMRAFLRKKHPDLPREKFFATSGFVWYKMRRELPVHLEPSLQMEVQHGKTIVNSDQEIF